MVKEIVCDIFDAPINRLVHCCSCQCRFGSGIALAIKKEYPEAYEIDLQTSEGDRTKMGNYSLVTIKNYKKRRNPNLQYIYNLYAQFNYGTYQRQVDYEAFYEGLELIKNNLRGSGDSLGFPYKIASDRAGGNWRIIKTMIEEVFNELPNEILICKRPGD